MHTLVLNRNFHAIQVTPWRRALSLVYLDHAEVVDEDFRRYSFEDWAELSLMMDESPEGFVHTTSIRLRIPEVIALKAYKGLPPIRPRFTRRNIYEHYGYRCCYCGRKFPSSDLNLEHVVPRSRGGRTDWDNIVTACIPCNSRKGSHLPSEAGMKLKIRPNRPKPRFGGNIFIKSGFRMKESWQKFLDTAYWNIELDPA